MRASAQMISYEVSMGLGLICVLMVSNSLNLSEIVMAQSKGRFASYGFDFLSWNWLPLLPMFGVYLISGVAETNRAPFDMPEGEPHLVGGYHTEFSRMRLGFSLFAEYTNMFISSAVIATLYFGGYHVPGLASLNLDPNLATIIGVAAMFAKTFFFIFFFMWVRWSIPRFRFDQLMNLGWKKLIPLGILNIVLTGGVYYFLKG